MVTTPVTITVEVTAGVRITVRLNPSPRSASLQASSRSPTLRGAHGGDADVVAVGSRDGLLFAAAAATALLQIGVALSWDGRTEHLAALASAWGGALLVTFLDGRPPDRRDAPALDAAIGAALLVCTWCVSIAALSDYSRVDRVLPPLAGIALVMMASGVRRMHLHWRQLMLLSLTLLHPPPVFVRPFVSPTRVTAATAASLMRAFGFEAQREGTLLVFPGASLRVYDACSGIILMTQMLLLGVVVICLIPMTVRRAVVLFISGMAIAFFVNVARITTLGILVARAPSRGAYLERYETGSALYPVIATVCGGVVWWCIARFGRNGPDRRSEHPIAG